MQCYHACMILVEIVWSIYTAGVISDLDRFYPRCRGCCSANPYGSSSTSDELKLGLMMRDTYVDWGSCSMNYAVKAAPNGTSSCHKIQTPGKRAYGM